MMMLEDGSMVWEVIKMRRMIIDRKNRKIKMDKNRVKIKMKRKALMINLMMWSCHQKKKIKTKNLNKKSRMRKMKMNKTKINLKTYHKMSKMMKTFKKDLIKIKKMKIAKIKNQNKLLIQRESKTKNLTINLKEINNLMLQHLKPFSKETSQTTMYLHQDQILKRKENLISSIDTLYFFNFCYSFYS